MITSARLEQAQSVVARAGLPLQVGRRERIVGSLQPEVFVVIASGIFGSMCLLAGSLHRERQKTRRVQAESDLRLVIGLSRADPAVLHGLAEVRVAEQEFGTLNVANLAIANGSRKVIP